MVVWILAYILGGMLTYLAVHWVKHMPPWGKWTKGDRLEVIIYSSFWLFMLIGLLAMTIPITLASLVEEHNINAKDDSWSKEPASW